MKTGQAQAYWKDNSLIRKRNVIKNSSYGNNSIRVNQKECVSFASNDYLGIAHHPKIKEHYIEGVKKYGCGSGSSALVSGYHDCHLEVETQFAEWLNVDKTLLFSSGYLANIGTLGALIGRNDTVYSDKLCHISLLQGIQLSRAKHYRYRHRDTHHLKVLQHKHSSGHIITESIFSMEGDISPIQDLANISAKLIIDDAHGIGIMGNKGRGLCDQQNIDQNKYSCVIAPLGKAFNGAGAFVAGKQDIIEKIVQHAKSYTYSTALPPAVCKALLASLAIVKEEEWRREKLNKNIHFFINHAREKRVSIMSEDQTPIKSINIGDNRLCMTIQEKLLKRGYYTSAIRPPTVPKNTARLRISLNCNHTETQMAELLDYVSSAIDHDAKN